MTNEAFLLEADSHLPVNSNYVDVKVKNCSFFKCTFFYCPESTMNLINYSFPCFFSWIVTLKFAVCSILCQWKVINQPSPTKLPSYYMSMAIKVIRVPGWECPWGNHSPHWVVVFLADPLHHPHPSRSSCIIHNLSWYLTGSISCSGEEVALKAWLQIPLTFT